MSSRPIFRIFSRTFLLLALGCALLLFALFEQPAYHRELTIVGVVVLLMALGSYLRRIVSP